MFYRFLALPHISPCHLGADIVRRDYVEEWRLEKASFVDQLMLIKGLQNHPMTFEQYLKFIYQEAVSEWWLYQQHSRRYIQLPHSSRLDG